MKGAQKKEFVVSNSLSILYSRALNVPLTCALLRFDSMCVRSGMIRVSKSPLIDSEK
jgi:hypothetical protein